MSKKITHATIFPLVGGMSVGGKIALGSDPIWSLSSDAFTKNESHFKKNFSNTPFHTIEGTDKDKWDRFDFTKLQTPDIVSAVPVCAGLSLLNSTSKAGSNKVRGSEADQNKWMHLATDVALGKIKPKVFFFENAPGLMQNLGKDMRVYLNDKAKQYGYSLSFLFTDSLLHGLPQSRKRTFAFFWNTPTAPKFNWVKKDYVAYEDFFKPLGTAEDSIAISKKELKDDPWFLFAKHKKGSDWRSITHKTIGQWIWKEGMMDEAIAFTKDEGMKKTLTHWKMKLSKDLGFWDSTPLLYKGHTNAVISKNIGMIHPKEDRFLNVREIMSLMGLPKEYSLDLTEAGAIVGSWNVCCQNVCCHVAADMFSYVKDVLENKVEYTDQKLVGWNNILQKKVEL